MSPAIVNPVRKMVGPSARIFDEYERLSDSVKISPHVTRLLGQNPGALTMQGTNSYLLQPPSNALAPLILIDTSSPHTAQQYVDMFLTHLYHLGLESGVREVHFESHYATGPLKHLPPEKQTEVKAKIIAERLDDPRSAPLELVEYGPGSGWARNSTSERRLPAIEHIILTHRHLDHVGALPLLLKTLNELGLPPPKLWKYPSPDEAKLAASPHASDRSTSDAALWENLPQGTYTRFAPLQPFHPIMPGLMISIIDPSYRHLLKHDKDGTPLWDKVPEVARVSVKCMRTPGVTGDSVSLILQEGDRGLFCGDICMGNKGPTTMGDMAAYLTSLKVLIALKPNALYPGHGNHVITVDATKQALEQALEHHTTKLDRLGVLMQDISRGGLPELMHALDVQLEDEKRAKDTYEEEYMTGRAAKKVKPDERTDEEKEKDKQEYLKKWEVDGEVPNAVSLEVITRLVERTGSDKRVWLFAPTVEAYLKKMEKDGNVRRTKAKVPKMKDRSVGNAEEIDAWEWVAAV